MRVDGLNEMVEFEFILSGVLLVFYLGKPIALINENGRILMRSEDYPIYLVDYLVENMNMHKYWLN